MEAWETWTVIPLVCQINWILIICHCEDAVSARYVAIQQENSIVELKYSVNYDQSYTDSYAVDKTDDTAN